MPKQDHINIFKQYFATNFWGNKVSSSGPNSDIRFTKKLCQSLQILLDALKPNSIVDAGCGDANLMQHVDLKNINYIGMDCVPELIEICRKKFSDKESMRFEVADVITAKLPQVDLIISRDVIHYLPNALIWDFLENIINSKAKYLLITHNTQCSASANDETSVGKFRPVNLCYPPFNFPKPQTTIAEDFFAKELALWQCERFMLTRGL